MSGWGFGKKASEKEKIKDDMADYLGGLNSCGDISYGIYSELFDYTMDLMDKMYEQGKKEDLDEGEENNES